MPLVVVAAAVVDSWLLRYPVAIALAIVPQLRSTTMWWRSIGIGSVVGRAVCRMRK